MEAFTDYPFEFLGDKPFKKAPVRPCTVISYDGDKYCQIIVEGSHAEIKAGYIYKTKGRCEEVDCIDLSELETK